MQIALAARKQEGGLTPAATYLDQLRAAGATFWNVPTIFFANDSEAHLGGTMGTQQPASSVQTKRVNCEIGFPCSPQRRGRSGSGEADERNCPPGGARFVVQVQMPAGTGAMAATR